MDMKAGTLLTMKVVKLLSSSLLFVILTGCFGPTTTQDPAITYTPSNIEVATPENQTPPTETVGRLRAEPITVDIQDILTTHARIREILSGLLVGQQPLTTDLQQEFMSLMDRSGPIENATELQHFKESLIGILTSYKLIFYEDSLASFQAGSYVKSEQRSSYEAYLLELGAINKHELEANDQLIHRIAAKLPIPYNGDQGVVIDEAILEVLIANQKKTNLRIDQLFDRYLSASTESSKPVPTPAADIAPEAVIPTMATVFTLGSTADEVEAVMGKPGWIQNYKYVGDEWQYGKSYVRFDADFRVNGFNNADNNLKIQMYEIIPNAEPFTKGSTRQQVAEVIGTPDVILNYNSAGSSWSYGKSRVDFDKEGIVKGWVNSADFDLFD